MNAWYLIYSKPKGENLAREHLERQGYQTYLPLAPVIRRRRGKAIRVIEPMFPRYLFIYLSDETDDWRPIRSTIGVSSLVRFGQVPVSLPDSLIKELKSRENEEGIQQLPEKSYSGGERVKIVEGPFQDYEAIYQCKTGKQRVSLLLKIAEHAVEIRIQKDQIEPL